MNLIDDCALSFYEEVGELNKEHHVSLVRHAETGKIFVKKNVPLYQRGIFTALKESPVRGMPRIFDLFEADGMLILIEEYLSGDTLEEKLRNHGPFSEEETIAWIRELCEIIASLHAFQPPIIHRDIKPSNIIISPDNSLKLLDLSAARQSAEEKSQDTVMMGTAGYAAPEQYGFSVSSPATDVYAIGVVMNRMLTGKMLNEVRYDGGLKKIIDTCTMLKPEERFHTVRELAACLKQYSGSHQAFDHRSVEKPSEKKDAVWKKYLPPGFRSGNPVSIILSIVGYFILFSLSLTLNTKNSTVAQTIINRCCVTLIFLSVILFTGNYLNIQSRFPLAKSAKLPVRIIGVILWNCVIIFALVAIAVILGG